MIKDIDVFGTVLLLDEDQNPMALRRSNWLKLSEDIGGMTLVGTFVRTNSLVSLEEEKNDA